MTSSLHEIRVADLMTRAVYTLTPTQSLPLAESLMELAHVRHLPVVDDGMLVGLVTHRDILAAKISALAPLTDDERSSLQLGVPVSRLMKTVVWTVREDSLAIAAARLMRDHKFGCLPVVDEGRLVGIVTEADLLALVTDALALERRPRRWRVEDAMTAMPVTLGPKETIADARAKMTRYAIRHLPIVEDGRPVTMVSDRDLAVAEVVFREAERVSAMHSARLVGTDVVRCVTRDAPLDDVLGQMFRERLDAVLVIEKSGDGDRLVGVVAASDACRLLANHLREAHVP